MDLTVLYVVVYGMCLWLAGYFVPFVRQRWLSRSICWSIVVTTVLFSTLITWSSPSLFRMIVIVTLQLLSMKILVTAETYSGKNKLTFTQWTAFALGWFGMRPILFETLPSKSLDYLPFYSKGFSRIVVGILLLHLSRRAEILFGEMFFLSDLLLLAGLSLILHFGILSLSTATWRLLGVNAPELFRSPYKATSLKEFWGRRWNIAFSEMTALIVYRPLKTKIGVEKAVAISFLVSGLLHEIAISFPVKSGYGLPMLYFGIHAVLMYLEGKLTILRKITSHPLLSHGWVMACLLIPMPLLFHNQFIHGVLIPLRSLLLNS